MPKNTTSIESEIKESLKNWRELIKSYQVPDNKKAVIQILNTFLPFVGIWTLMYFSLNWSIWLTIGLGIINAFFLVRIFIIQHDCGHQSFSSSKRMNNIIGMICSCFSTIPYKYWTKIHNFHHGHSGQMEVWEIGDIPTLTVEEYKSRSWFGKLRYRIWRMPVITFVVAPVYYMTISNRWPLCRTQLKNAKFLTKKNIKDNLLIVGVYALLGFLLGWKKFLFIQLFLIFIFGIIAFWFFYVQHQHERSYKEFKVNWDFLIAAIKGSSYYKLPRVFQWLTGNIGIHHIHHLSSLIPNYNLEKCLREKPILSKHVTIVTFWESLKMIQHKLWDEKEKKMVSFREATRLMKMRTQQSLMA